MHTWIGLASWCTAWLHTWERRTNRVSVYGLRVFIWREGLQKESRAGPEHSGPLHSAWVCSGQWTRREYLGGLANCCGKEHDLNGLSLVSLDLCWPYLSEEPARHRPWVGPLVHGMVAYLDWAGLLVHGMVAYLGTAHKLCVRLWDKRVFIWREGLRKESRAGPEHSGPLPSAWMCSGQWI